MLTANSYDIGRGVPCHIGTQAILEVRTGVAGRFDRHRRIARIAFPLWLYVAVTGVIVYLMISPYYAH